MSAAMEEASSGTRVRPPQYQSGYSASHASGNFFVFAAEVRCPPLIRLADAD